MKYYGEGTTEICEALARYNGLDDPTLIWVGQTLKIAPRSELGQSGFGPCGANFHKAFACYSYFCYISGIESYNRYDKQAKQEKPVENDTAQACEVLAGKEDI